MKFNVTEVEFDFDDDYAEESKLTFDEYCESVDSIFEILEGSVDRYYDKVEKAKAKQPTGEW